MAENGCRGEVSWLHGASGHGLAGGRAHRVGCGCGRGVPRGAARNRRAFSRRFKAFSRVSSRFLDVSKRKQQMDAYSLACFCLSMASVLLWTYYKKISQSLDSMPHSWLKSLCGGLALRRWSSSCSPPSCRGASAARSSACAAPSRPSTASRTTSRALRMREVTTWI